MQAAFEDADNVALEIIDTAHKFMRIEYREDKEFGGEQIVVKMTKI